MGFDPDGFWPATPREISIRFDAAMQRAKREQADYYWLAWHVAAYSRADPLPEFDPDVLRSRPDRMDDRALEAAFDSFYLTFGGDPAALRAAKAGAEKNGDQNR